LFLQNTVLHNQVGTAPGMWMKKKHRFISLPGVPYEMKYLVENEIIQRLLRTAVHYPQNNSYGQGESLISDGLKPGKTAFRNFETGLPAKSRKSAFTYFG
jgi:nicotinamide-nucleotide amidase